MIWLAILLVVGVNMLIWGAVGVLRFLDEAPRRSPRARLGTAAVHLSDVAVLMAAHNEEAVIGTTLGALVQLVPAANVHVVSDWSSDRTVEIAERVGVNVVETPRNTGKASALAYGRDEFGLLDRYRAVMILDADTKLDPDYFEVALPLFDDPRVVAVAGCAHTWWQRRFGVVGNVLVTHRQRVYVLTQHLLKYGQTWRGISAVLIVPGFASLYRTEALRQIEIDPPGLVIEDFNMTFQVQAKKLGRIAFHPGAKAYTQDPANLRDYVKQIRRWDLGFWQTVRRWRGGRAVFGATLLMAIAELLASSALLVLLPVLALVAALDTVPGLAATPGFGPVLGTAVVVAGVPSLLLLAATDYALTCVVAAVERRPLILLAGLLSLPMRVVDAAVALYTLPRAWLDQSNGQWVSPQRRLAPAVASGSESTLVPNSSKEVIT